LYQRERGVLSNPLTALGESGNIGRTVSADSRRRGDFCHRGKKTAPPVKERERGKKKKKKGTRICSRKGTYDAQKQCSMSTAPCEGTFFSTSGGTKKLHAGKIVNRLRGKSSSLSPRGCEQKLYFRRDSGKKRTIRTKGSCRDDPMHHYS